MLSTSLLCAPSNTLHTWRRLRVRYAQLLRCAQQACARGCGTPSRSPRAAPKSMAPEKHPARTNRISNPNLSPKMQLRTDMFQPVIRRYAREKLVELALSLSTRIFCKYRKHGACAYATNTPPRNSGRLATPAAPAFTSVAALRCITRARKTPISSRMCHLGRGSQPSPHGLYTPCAYIPTCAYLLCAPQHMRMQQNRRKTRNYVFSSFRRFRRNVRKPVNYVLRVLHTFLTVLHT